MVKGTKRKIPIEKITKKNSLATCFTKRRDGLYSKASQLCLLSGAQIAILATPSSSQSTASFYSFGHSSVDAVVSAFLAGKRPVPVPEENRQTREDIGVCLARKDLGLGFWWDDERLNGSENPEEVKDAIESMSILLTGLRSEDAVNHQAFDEDLKKKKKKKKEIGKKDVVVLHHGTRAVNQTLNLQSTSAICCVPDDTESDLPEIFNKNTEEKDQILLISDNNNNGLSAGNLDEYNSNEVMDLDELIDLLSDGTFKSIPDDCLEKDGEIIVLDDDDQPADLNNKSEEQDQILLISDSYKNDLPAGNRNLDDQEMEDIDQLIDFETCFEGLVPDEVFSAQELEEFAASFLMTRPQPVHHAYV